MDVLKETREGKTRWREREVLGFRRRFAISSLFRLDSDLMFFIKVVDHKISCNLESRISRFGAVFTELRKFQVSALVCLLF